METKLGIQIRGVPSKRDLKERNRQLSNETVRDPLTGLYNLRGLEQETKRIINVLKRENRLENYVVVGMDMIGLKRLNESLKMSGANSKLRQASDCISMVAKRSEDVAARFGGDEFVIIFFNTHSDVVRQKINELRINFPEEVKFNFVFKSFGPTEEIKKSIELVTDKIDEVKKFNVDETGRSTGQGVVVGLN